MTLGIWFLGFLAFVIAGFVIFDGDSEQGGMTLFLGLVWPVSLPFIAIALGFFYLQDHLHKKKKENKAKLKERQQPFESHEAWVKRTGIELPSEAKRAKVKRPKARKR